MTEKEKPESTKPKNRARNKKTTEQKKKHLEGILTPLEQKIVNAELVRIHTLGGTSLTGPVAFIDRYNVLIGNIVIPKHAIDFYEVEPDLDDDDDANGS